MFYRNSLDSSGGSLNAIEKSQTVVCVQEKITELCSKAVGGTLKDSTATFCGIHACLEILCWVLIKLRKEGDWIIFVRESLCCGMLIPCSAHNRSTFRRHPAFISPIKNPVDARNMATS